MSSANNSENYRIEKDIIGEKSIPKRALYGIHTARALENFPLSNRKVNNELIKAYGMVKLACSLTNASIGVWEDDYKREAIITASTELSEGKLTEYIVVDSLQGGAGTSLNMNVNEVIANRALELCNKEYGDYEFISPNDDINLHQSTNDTYPTALKLASINLIRELEESVVSLQEAFQEKEKAWKDIVKVARTQLQDAVLTTLGREMGAYAECFTRDRWRIYKCEERLRVINLGGTAIGTGLGAPKKFIFRATDKLRELTGVGFARSENLIDTTQNADVFVEVSGILKALASSLLKVSTDIRLMSSGPQAGLSEIILPKKQAGSSIMPGKINPVIPEAVSQAAMMVIANDVALTTACSMGNLELNPFLPLVAHTLLDSLHLLKNACDIFRIHCIVDMKPNIENCNKHVLSSTATITALLPKLGYDKLSDIIKNTENDNINIKEAVIKTNLLTEAEFEELISPEAVTRLGSNFEI